MNIIAKRFILSKRPVGIPDESTFGMQEVKLPNETKANELCLHSLYFSVDPYMRSRMNDAKSYVPPFEMNQPIEGSVIARVVESKDSNFKTGDLVLGQLPWATDMLVTTDRVRKINSTEAQASEYLGVLGMTGLTAYFGLLKIGQPKTGETVLISGAAGAVGNVVGQIAKIKGCKVVGIVGSDEKERLLKDRFQFDETVDYKKHQGLEQRIKKACPQGVDVYYDNVGGEVSDAALQNMNSFGRVVLCGQIALYNSKDVGLGPRLQPLMLVRSLLMQGFIISQFENQFPEALKDLTNWVRDGKIKSSETILEGFHNLPKAFIGLFSGKNIGKMIVKA